MDDRRAGIPQFDTLTIEGERVRYRDLWQRRNLLLVTLHGADPGPAEAYAAEMRARANELRAHDTVLVVTNEAITGLSAPALLVADRWGEIHFTQAARHDLSDLPNADALVEWRRYLQVQCPECQGEAR